MIAVSGGNTLTLTGTIEPAAAGNNLTKTDNGTLVMSNTVNGSWTGGITINAGAVQPSTTASLGTGTITVGNFVGAALQVNSATPTISNAMNLSNQGLNYNGALENQSGNNTYSGVITLANAANIGVDTGSSATFNNATFANGGNALTLVGAGTGTIASQLTGAGAVTVFAPGGVWSLTASDTALGALSVNAGTLALSGSGVNGTGVIAINYGGTLNFDDTGVNGPNRSNGHTLQITDGTFNVLGNASAATTESLYGINFQRGEDVISVVANGGTLSGGAATLSLVNGGAWNHAANTSLSSVLFQGTYLGQAAGAGVATVSTTAAMTLQGSGTSGQTTKGILPWALAYDTTGTLPVSFATANTTTGAYPPAELRHGNARQPGHHGCSRHGQ